MTQMTSRRQKDIRVELVPHPFTLERIHSTVPEGQSIAAIITQLQGGVAVSAGTLVYLNGHEIAPKNWPRVKPKAGAVITVRRVPLGGGGGGKNPLRTVMSLAVMAASPFITSALTGVFGANAGFLGISAGRLITGGVNLLGRLALNALAPPGRPRFSGGLKESPTLFIQGARNQAVPFGRVPKILGRHRFVPPLGALPYTETVGNDQYIRMLFIWGYGPIRLGDMKIGETSLQSFTDVEVETRLGFPGDAPLTLFSNTVIQNDLDVLLTQAAGHVLRTTADDTEEISVDITFQRGLVRFSGAQKLAATVTVEVQYAPAGTSDWSLPAQTFTAFPARQVTLTPAPAAYVQGGQGVEVLREDRIYLDPASGQIGVVEGAAVRFGIDPEAAPALLPAGALPVVRVRRRSGDAGVIAPTSLIDERQSAYDSGIFSATTDFVPTYAGTINTIDIAAGSMQYPGFTVTAKQTAALRRAVTLRVPRGKYDVRLRRLTSDSTDDNTFDEVSWTALRSIRSALPVRMPGVAMTALRIKATDQLNGFIERFNGVIETIAPDWTGSGWVEQQTSNPAALFRHILQSSANARPLNDTRIDIAGLQAWHDFCRLQGYQYNGVIDYDVSVSEALQNVAAAGRASPTIVDGKWSAVIDRPVVVPVQHFTPANTASFKGEKTFDELPHALRVRFINKDKGWLQDERLVYDDGYNVQNALKYETLELNGVTSADEAWKAGRYHIATARLRPETYSFVADIEHIVCTRGDLIRFTHDVPLFGLATARIAAVQTNAGFYASVTLDNAIEMQAGRNYSLRVRKADGASGIYSLQTMLGLQTAAYFSTAVPVSEGLAVGNLVMFGETGSESVELIVRSIEPQGDLSARITCVDAAPGVHIAAQGDIPAHNSQVTIPPELQRPPVPVVSSLQSGEEVLVRNIDGSLSNKIVITLEPAGSLQNLTLRVLIRGKDEAAYVSAQLSVEAQNVFSVQNVEEGEIYDLQLRYASPTGIYSDSLSITDYVVSGGLSPPMNVENFNISVNGDTAQLAWRKNQDVDLSHYVIRFYPDVLGAEWASAVDLVASVPGDATSYVAPSLLGTYLIKAVDVGGRQSVDAAAVVSTIVGLSGYNAVLDVDESATFPGMRAGLVCVDDGLRLEGLDSVDDWGNLDVVANVDVGLSGYNLEGTYTFATDTDLGAVYTSRLTADLRASGYSLNTIVETWPQVDVIESWDQSAGANGWDVKLELRTTQDDPISSPVWSDWRPLIVGDYSARAFQFRMRAFSLLPNITPFISAASIRVDMPDRIEAQSNIICPAAIQTVPFPRAFRLSPAVAICGQNMQTGDYFAVTNIQPGQFDLQFFNAAGASVARVFDYIAKGFGERV